MIRYLRNGALAFALMGAGFLPASASAASPTSPTMPNAPAKEEYKPDQIIVMKESGKPERRCKIVSANKSPDGTMTYQVKALDNGEMMTIHDRVPATTAKPAPSNPAPPRPSGVVNKSEADLPRAKPRTSDPLLNPPLPTPGKAPVVAAKPEPEKSRFRLFGKSEKQPAPAKQAVASSSYGTAKATPEPPMARVPNEPLPIGFGPQLPMTVPMPRSTANEPASVALYQAPPDPARVALTLEKERIEEWKDNLKTALRPSERMAAAEALCAPTRITDADTRAAVMLAAQDDPAGVVRAACIRGMSRSGLRDQAYMTLLVACQSDRDKSVREEAIFALQKATRR